MISGFSHVGVSTLNMTATLHFYEVVLGFKRVVENNTIINEGGILRQVYFDIGESQYIVFMEPKNVSSISSDYDPGINSALGLPAGMYHFAFKVSNINTLEEKRQMLIASNIEVSEIIDLGHAKSIFFSDPNNIQLEISVQTRDFNQQDLNQTMHASLAPVE